ncbi:MAG: very short patch repair endonuclease [Bacteroidales bacterium]|nr:very short patch repair endonuclease [Bacteroidales bacterium]
MPDPLTPQQRHDCMSHILSRNTKPEVKLRKELFRLGYRYRVNVKGLDGKPDIVLAKYRTCIFVNGCFWHGHKGCPRFVMPKTNVEFWLAKIENNRERDLKDYTFLESRGWRVIVAWECELAKADFRNTVSEIQRQLDINRESWLEEMADRRKRREEWREEMRRRKERERDAKNNVGRLNINIIRKL